jgi:hypothetical protein
MIFLSSSSWKILPESPDARCYSEDGAETDHFLLSLLYLVYYFGVSFYISWKMRKPRRVA